MMIVIVAVGAVALATPTLVSPASSSKIQGTVTLNASITGWSDQDLLNISYYGYSSDTANSSAIVVASRNEINFTNSLQDLNVSFDTTGLEDGATYTWLVQIVNNSVGSGSDAANSSTSTSVIVDNTIPQAPTSLTSATQTSSSFTLSSTVVGVNTTACTLSWVGSSPLSGSSPSGTHSGDSCTFSLSSAAEGSYIYQITASDGSNSTASSEQSIKIDTPSGTGGGAGNAATVSEVAQSLGELKESAKEKVGMVAEEFTKEELAKTAIAGVIGFAAGSFFPVVGNIIGLVVGIIVGVIL